MMLVPGTPDEYTMEGSLAEIFFVLQVNGYSTVSHCKHVSYTFAFKDVLNFSYSLKKPPDGQWGAKQADGSWNGMINLLQTKQADIGLKKLDSLYFKYY